jgi:hypothetical protein
MPIFGPICKTTANFTPDLSVKHGQLASQRHLEDRTGVAVGPVVCGRPIQVAISSLNQPIERGAAVCTVEAMQCGQHTLQSDLEHSPTAALTLVLTVGTRPTVKSCPVKIPIAGLG